MTRSKKHLTRNSLNKLTKEQETCTVLPTNILAGPRPKKASRKAVELNEEAAISNRKKRGGSVLDMNKRSSRGPSLSAMSSERSRVYQIHKTTRTQPAGVGGLRNPPSATDKSSHKRKVESVSMSDMEGDSDSDYDGSSEVPDTENSVGQGLARRSSAILPATPARPSSSGTDRALRSKTATGQGEDEANDPESGINNHGPETRFSKRQRMSTPSALPKGYVSPYGPQSVTEPSPKPVIQDIETSAIIMDVEVTKDLEGTPQLSPAKDGSDGRTPHSSPKKNGLEDNAPDPIFPNGSDGRILPPNHQALVARQETPTVSQEVDEQLKKSWSTAPDVLNSPQNSVQIPAIQNIPENPTDTTYLTPPSSIQAESPFRIPVPFEILYPDMANKDDEDRNLVVIQGANYVMQPQDKHRLGLLDQVHKSKEFFQWIADIRELRIALADEEGKKRELELGILESQKAFEAEMSKLNEAFEALRGDDARRLLQHIREMQEPKGEEELKILQVEEQELMTAMRMKEIEICRKEELCRRHFRHAKSAEQTLVDLLDYVRSLPEPDC